MMAKTMELTKMIDASVAAQGSRAAVLAAAVALAVASSAAIPSSPVDSAGSHYVTVVAPATRSAISKLNEALVFDVRLCVEMTRAFWSVRYNSAHPLTTLSYTNQNCGFFCTLAAGCNYFSPDQITLLNANEQAIMEAAHYIQLNLLSAPSA